jgi:transcriptional regulator with XRE-family HTH domain
LPSVVDYSNEAFGQVVRDGRTRRGLTQEELGRAAGYRTGAGVSISRVEAGLVRPGSERLAGLAEALGLTEADLEARAAALTTQKRAVPLIGGGDGGPPPGVATSRGSDKPKDRALRVQREVDRRTTVITDLTEAFNAQHDRARD